MVKGMKICIVSNDATYGNGAALSEGLKNFADVETVFRARDVKSLYKQTDCRITNDTPESDHYIIIGAISLRNFPRKFYNKSVTIILSGSCYRNSPETYNKIISDNKWNVFAMPDLAPLNGTKNIYYQPFYMPRVNTHKTEVVCHSPAHHSKLSEKGTDIIKDICNRNHIPLTVIMNDTWGNTIKIKGRYKYFIDQLYSGIGKSGLEAMLLDCVVFSGVKPQGENLPPIVWTDKNTLERDLLRVMSSPEEEVKIINRQRLWAAINLNPKIVARKIIDTL
jgi:hypothetical protein